MSMFDLARAGAKLARMPESAAMGGVSGAATGALSGLALDEVDGGDHDIGRLLALIAAGGVGGAAAPSAVRALMPRQDFSRFAPRERMLQEILDEIARAKGGGSPARMRLFDDAPSPQPGEGGNDRAIQSIFAWTGMSPEDRMRAMADMLGSGRWR